MARALVPEPPSSVLVAMLPAPADVGDVAGRLAALGPVEREGDALTLADGDLRVDVEPTKRPSERLSERLRGDPFTAGRLDRAQGALRLESRLPTDAPLRGLQRLYRAGEVATGGDALLWYDVEKEREVDREEVSLLSHDDSPPSVENAIEMDCVYAEPSSPTCWIHTHGLARLGRPDLEAFDVPRPRRGQAIDLVNEIAAWLLENELPPEGGEVPLPSHPVWLEPLHARIERLPPGTLGKDLDDRNPDERRIERRMALVFPRGRGPGGLLRRRFTHDLEHVLAAREAASTVTRIHRPEADRRAALVRRTRPLLAALWRRREPEWVFVVKLGLPTGLDGPTREHLWFEVVAIEGDRLRGRLDNEPLHRPDLTCDDVLDEDLGLATDWFVRVGDRRHGPLRAHRLLGPDHGIEPAPPP